MKERPILMQSDNVKAILEDRKTQTRRIIKGVPACADSVGWDIFSMSKGKDWVAARGPYGDHNRGEWFIRCPYGQVGDRLWVRETWATSLRIDHIKPSDIGEAFGVPLWYKSHNELPKEGEPLKGKWRPSIFMPRWASRITLEITGVRVERLQEIGLLDAQEEGFNLNDPVLAKVQFINKWNSLNAKRGYGWDTNPWVWVIEFRRLTDAIH